MTTKVHTDVAVGAAANASIFNAPFGQLDSGLADLRTSVKDLAYGAVGNNVADDTTAIQAAITATAAGGTVYLPPGTYKTTATLTIPYGVTVRGASRFGTTISYTGTGIGIQFGLNVQNAQLCELTLNCTSTAATVIGVQVGTLTGGDSNNQSNVLSHCLITTPTKTSGQIGVLFAAPSITSSTYWNRMESCDVRNFSTGIQFDTAGGGIQQADANHISNCSLVNGDIMINLKKGGENMFVGVSMDTFNSGVGVQILNGPSPQNYFYGCRAEGGTLSKTMTIAAGVSQTFWAGLDNCPVLSTDAGTNTTFIAQNIVTLGPTSSAGLINGQTISSSANLTGTLTLGSQLVISANGAAITGAILMNSAAAIIAGGATNLNIYNHATSQVNLGITDAGVISTRSDLVLGTAPRILTTGTVPTVGSGGAGTSALSILANSTNTSGRFQVTLTAVAPGVVAGVVAFGGGAVATAPLNVVCSLSAPTAGVASPPIVGADTYTTSGFTVRVYGPTTVTTGTYVINYFVTF